MKEKELEQYNLSKWDYVRNVVNTKLSLAKMEMDERATKRNIKLFNKYMEQAIHYLYKERVLKFKPKVKYKYVYSYEGSVVDKTKGETVADMVLVARNAKSEEFAKEVIK